MQSSEFRDRYGPVALVTGASSGIGVAFAKALAKRGLDLVIVARREDRLKELSQNISDTYDVGVQVCVADLADPKAVGVILNACQASDVGLVVSNAGFGAKGSYTSVADTALTDMLMVNSHAPMLLAHNFIPRLRERGKGGLIFTNSIEGLMGCPYSTAYSATKALVNALGEGLWAELEPEGVDVLTVCPGATESEAAAKQGIDPETLQNVMRAEDVAESSLDNITNGPTFFPSEHYRANFDKLLSLPRRDALRMIAPAMKR